jgi:hypothetical protein
VRRREREDRQLCRELGPRPGVEVVGHGEREVRAVGRMRVLGLAGQPRDGQQVPCAPYPVVQVRVEQQLQRMRHAGHGDSTCRDLGGREVSGRESRQVDVWLRIVTGMSL